MTDSSSSEIELELYEEVINMNYSTPMASVSSPLSHDKNESSMSHFNGPIVSSSESEVVSTPLDSSLPSRGPITSRQFSRATVAEASGRKFAPDICLSVSAVRNSTVYTEIKDSN